MSQLMHLWQAVQHDVEHGGDAKRCHGSRATAASSGLTLKNTGQAARVNVLLMLGTGMLELGLIGSTAAAGGQYLSKHVLVSLILYSTLLLLLQVCFQ